MSVYNDEVEIHAGEDVPFSADYDPCADSAPTLAGMTFQFTAVPVDGTGATITKSVTVTGTVLSWTIAAADTTSRVDEVFRAQLRRTDSGSNRVWAQWVITVVN
jgi:hypothetical protein